MYQLRSVDDSMASGFAIEDNLINLFCFSSDIFSCHHLVITQSQQNNIFFLFNSKSIHFRKYIFTNVLTQGEKEQ